MLSAKLLAFAGAGLLISAPIFPQHAPGFLAAGAISGGACWVIGEKERDVSKRLTGLTEKERLLKSDQSNIEVLKEKYNRSLAEIDGHKKELSIQADVIADQRLECNYIKSLKAGLDERESKIKELQIELEKVASEQKERRGHLEGWSSELETLESVSRSEKEKLAVWANDLKHQTTDIERQRVEVQKNRDSFNELLKAYQIEVWEKMKPQAQAHAETIIAERQKPLELWCEELKQKDAQLNGILPSIGEAREKELKELREKWEEWAKDYQDDCNGKIRAALDDRNAAHDTWKQHYMALAGKTYEENQQLRKVVYSPARHWYELKADTVIEFLNANEVAVDYYQALPTPDEKGFYLELQPKWGSEALADVLTGVTKLRDAPRAKVTFLNLSAPNQYKFSQTKTVQNQLEDLYRRSPEADSKPESSEKSAESETTDTIQDKGGRPMDTADSAEAKTGKSANMPIGGESGLLSDKDVERVALIERLREEGKTTLKEVIGIVWADIEGIEKYNSRVWKRAREEYRRLTGK